MNRSLTFICTAVLAAAPRSAAAQHSTPPSLFALLNEGAEALEIPKESILFVDTASVRKAAGALKSTAPAISELTVAFGRDVRPTATFAVNPKGISPNVEFVRMDSIHVSASGIDLFVTRSGSYRPPNSATTYHGKATYVLRYNVAAGNWRFAKGMIVVIE